MLFTEPNKGQTGRRNNKKITAVTLEQIDADE